MGDVNLPASLDLVGLAVGLLLIFAGWALYRTGLRLMGAILGIAVSFLLIYAVLTGPIGKSNPRIEDLRLVIFLVGTALGGILGSILVMKVYYLLVAFVFGVMGVFYQQGVPFQEWTATIDSQFWSDLLSGPAGAAILAAVFALLGVALHKYLMILLTSILGSLLVMTALPENVQHVLVVPILVVIGILFQAKIIQGRKKSDDPEKANV